MSKATLAVIYGNRDFFPDILVTEARKDMEQVFTELDIEAVVLDEKTSKLGAVETWEDAKKCAALFKENMDRIDGILVVLPNFGDEKGVADSIKLSRLRVPILIQAYPDDNEKLNIERRRDSFCGKISVCSNLRQYGFPYTLTDVHNIYPTDDRFKIELMDFLGICRVVRGLRNARFGAIGARPNAFNTVRYSEKLLQEAGMSVSTIDLSEIFANAQKIETNDQRVKTKVDEIIGYAKSTAVPSDAIILMAKLGLVISDWIEELDLNATALQCWNSLQENYGVNACTLMSMMSEQLLPNACEVDITGVAAMYALQLASGKPSALVDWNNNYGDDPDKCVFFHCGNWAKSFLPDIEIKYADILSTTLGQDRTWGAVAGRTPAGPVTFARISTDDTLGMIRVYVGEGEFTDDPLETFGARAVVKVPALQDLLKYICLNGFEHHVAMNASQTAHILNEAFGTYLDWDVYFHQE